jgi:diguanylate cyclase (GGDEF)-like protein
MNPTILVVDDSADSRILMKQFLKREGYRNVLAFETAEEVIKLMGEGREQTDTVDLILLDIIMPGMDGIEFCNRKNDIKKLRDVPVIMVTGMDNSVVLNQAFEAGAVDYIKKPFDSLEIKARINSAIRLKQEIDKRKQKEIELLQVNKDLSELNKVLEQQAVLDGLTGISNRRNFDKVLNSEWKRAVRSSVSLAIIMIDIDCFKPYNDTYGHQSGDDCLKLVAKTLEKSLERSSDLVARYGGEEFVAILPDIEHEAAKEIAEKIRANIEACQIPHETSTVKNVITISLGLATVVPSKNYVHMDAKDLINLADKALYQSKNDGRNRVTDAMIPR